jgi:hypothetical protein
MNRSTRQVCRIDAPGKPCGKTHIPQSSTCHLTPSTLAKVPRQGTGAWRRKVAIAAGVGATSLAVGLPVASFMQSGTAPGRRASKAVEALAREAGKGLMTWAPGPLAPAGVPLGMGAMVGAEGMRAGRVARRVAESLRTAPGFARGAANLASRKVQLAGARRAYLEKMQAAWAAGQKPITPAEARRRANEVRKVEEQIARLSRQAATRSTAARRAARIARTGAAFRSSSTPTEAWLRASLQSDPLTRAPASLTAGFLRTLQRTRQGANARRPRFYR